MAPKAPNPALSTPCPRAQQPVMSCTSAFISVYYQEQGPPFILVMEVFTSEVPNIILSSCSIVTLFPIAIQEPTFRLTNVNSATKAWLELLLVQNDHFFIDGWNAAVTVAELIKEMSSGYVLLRRLDPNESNSQ
ncbi:hypothetical protein SCLCIDRAFT_7872 [Scleroderma citrinum Foug A]|uniref:Uncharacterized protein n=1 Tax=Scleroderma citrinum Foug A TaxID=1036808 RepID=A0A0C3AND4_9AGAM|nr:hypothetical protein SCLCIDRAFT_7872 [Scleroderma citrinum Foug A]